MRLAIISDIHDNQANLTKFLTWCAKENIDQLLCCGDVTNGETLRQLNSFSGKVYLVEGNAEVFDQLELKECDNIKRLGRFGNFNLGKNLIGACHEPDFINDVLETREPNIIFYGHTHKPWRQTYRGIETVNPGTLGGVFNRATFAVWDIDEGLIELKILDLI